MQNAFTSRAIKIIASWSPPDILRIALQKMLTMTVSIAIYE